MLLEELLGITAVTRPSSLQVCGAPSTRIGVVGDIARDAIPWETPNLDTITSPLHSEHTTSSGIEPGTVTSLGVVHKGTTFVRPFARSASGLGDFG